MNNWQEFLEKGKETEVRFAKVLVMQLGGEVFASDSQTDITKHIDLFWKPSVQKGFQNKERKYGIDVKGLKRNLRNGDCDEDIHWIEYQNVRGEKGWLRGDADFFAFETCDYWILVGKKALQHFWQKKAKDQSVIYNSKTYEFYKLYQRFNREDIIMKVKTLDLMALANKILSKQ